MKQLLLSATCSLLFVNYTAGQTQVLQVSPNIVLPKDSTTSKLLIASLDNFLVAARGANETNAYVYDKEKIETYIQLDEINGIEQSGRFKDEHFYKPYLANVVPLKDSTYYIQVAYMGASNNTPMLRAAFEFIARKRNDTFRFSSMLVKNATDWKTEIIGNMVYHYRTTLNKAKAKRYAELAATFDKKLKAANTITEFYCCDNLTELQKLIGVDYKSDYNGQTSNVWASRVGNKKLVVLGNGNGDFSHYDEHDLWHERLAVVIPRNQVDHSTDEGCAYLYGGSWGLQWKDIFKAFYQQTASNKTTDWADIKEHPVYFKTKGIDNNADFIITALLVQKIEKEKGFTGVWQLLNCGKGNYYTTLETLTGITKADYNKKCWELVQMEKKGLGVKI